MKKQLDFEAMQAKTELADLRDQTFFKLIEMNVQIEEAEGSCHGSTISPSPMSLSIKENKHNDIMSYIRTST